MRVVARQNSGLWLSVVPQASSIDVTDQAQDGLVQLQSPGGGTPAKPGTKVILRIGTFTGGDTTTTTTTTTTTP